MTFYKTLLPDFWNCHILWVEQQDCQGAWQIIPNYWQKSGRSAQIAISYDYNSSIARVHDSSSQTIGRRQEGQLKKAFSDTTLKRFLSFRPLYTLLSICHFYIIILKLGFDIIPAVSSSNNRWCFFICWQWYMTMMVLALAVRAGNWAGGRVGGRVGGLRETVTAAESRPCHSMARIGPGPPDTCGNSTPLFYDTDTCLSNTTTHYNYKGHLEF